jgi:methylglyoxal synthase
MNSETTIIKKKRIGVVAQDNKKTDLINWAYFNKRVLMNHELVAADTTGNILEGTLNTPVRKLASRPLGGDRELAALMSEGELDAIIFFWDPLESLKHDNGIKALVNKALTCNIVIASNRETADFV